MNPGRLKTSRTLWCSGRAAAMGIFLAVSGARGTTFLQEEYAVEVWQTQQGLPQNSICSIVQTPDGYLWLATFGGLARFDGMRFQVFDDHNTPALTSSSLVRLDLDTAGGLWIITESGALACMRGQEFMTYGVEQGIPPAGASAISCRRRDGQVWLRDRNGGLHTLDGRNFVPRTRPEWLDGDALGNFGFDHEDELWSRQGRRLGRWQDGQFLVLKNPGGDSEAVVRGCAPAITGGLVVVTSLGLQKYCHGKWEGAQVRCPDEMRNLTTVLEDRHGQVWVGTYGNGLFRYDEKNAWRHFTVGNGLQHNAVRAVFEDREGNIWIGTDGGGLHRFRPRLFRGFDSRHGLTANVVMSVSEGARDVVWLGLNGGGMHRLEGGRTTTLAQPPFVEARDYIYSILQDRSATVWVGTYDRGLAQYRDGRFAGCPPGDGPTNGAVRALLEDRSGAIWVGGRDGLWRIREGRCTRVSFAPGVRQTVQALAEDSAGSLYIGTDGDGLYRIPGAPATHYTERDGLGDNHVSCIYVDAEDVAWIGGGNAGISRLQHGRFERYSSQTGLPSDRISSILEDDSGRLWFGSERGIFRASRAELLARGASGQPFAGLQLYTTADGLSGLQCSGGVQPACWKARDGKLWFATVQGVAVVDPKSVVSNPLPPPVVIEEVLLDNRAVKPRDWSATADRLPRLQRHPGESTPGRLVIPPRVDRLEFRFTGLSLVAPEKVRFRYRLDGFDNDWIEAAGTRAANYTRIPPGQYRFQVKACNNDGIWNETGASLGVVALPPWWLTWWFRALAVLGLAGLLFWVVEARLRRVKRSHAAQRAFARRLLETQEEVRSRIAGELHDSLGQNLLVIKNRALLGLRAGGTASAATEQFTEISNLASDSLTEVRQISHDLRPYQLDRLGLTKALQAMLTSVSSASGLQCSAQLDRLEGLLPQPLEIHVYRIVQELVNNVVQHSHASQARVSATVDDHHIVLRCEDDGCGFDNSAAGEQLRGVGLTDIAERVHILGGAFHCDSQRAQGTRWTIEIPLNGKGRRAGDARDRSHGNECAKP